MTSSSLRSGGAVAPVGVPGSCPGRAGRRLVLCSWQMSVQADARVPLRGRASECAALDELLTAVRAGQSGALVLRGEAGTGKTALLDYAAAGGDGSRVVHAVGVESEMELTFAALHQLCLQLLDGLERLPPPQRDALGTAFGMSAGPPPDRF